MNLQDFLISAEGMVGWILFWIFFGGCCILIVKSIDQARANAKGKLVASGVLLSLGYSDHCLQDGSRAGPRMMTIILKSDVKGQVMVDVPWTLTIPEDLMGQRVEIRLRKDEYTIQKITT